MERIETFGVFSPLQFFAIQWAVAALALVCLALRLAIRWRKTRNLSSDDGLIVIAWVLLVANNILWHSQLSTVYEINALNEGRLQDIGEPKLAKNVRCLMRALLGFNILSVSSLWAVKFTFLIFFRQNRNAKESRNAWWWIVTTLTVATYIVCIVDFDWKCSLGSIAKITGICLSKKTQHSEAASFRARRGLDVAVNLLLMSLGFRRTWGAGLPLRKKVALGGILVLAFVTSGCSLIRLITIHRGTMTPEPRRSFKWSSIEDMTWSFTWNSIEMASSIMVATLGCFHQLYVNSESPTLVEDLEAESTIQEEPIQEEPRKKTARDSIARAPCHVEQLPSPKSIFYGPPVPLHYSNMKNGYDREKYLGG
ncbi:hypothetical protein BJ875DRAFT_247990 [Amylocarpus encephaloides]|uniref:Rhodopsin domain-containing protein n=1 Tax=Amylocarpus encephaloides TaxID=45428 RepID=A0A9P8C6U8_9HELO|nr:hypothetical protein BJ875DRAFT_247990 [Amylocarpus encephaloides]